MNVPQLCPQARDCQQSTTEQLVAGLRRRLVARLIDAGVKGLIFYVALASALFASLPEDDFFFLGDEVWIALLPATVACAFLLVSEPCAVALKGRTLGKRIAGIAVRSSDDPRQVPTFTQSVVRYLVPAVLGGVLILLAWAIVGPLGPGRSADGNLSLFEYILRNDSLSDDPDAVLWFGVWASFLGPFVGAPLGSAALILSRWTRGDARRGWHDRLAGTTVVQMRARGSHRPVLDLPGPERLGTRRKRFMEELRAGQLEQYETDRRDADVVTRSEP